MSVGEHEDVDQEFLSGFENPYGDGQTTTPASKPDEFESRSQDKEDAKEPEPIAETKASEPEVEYAKITKSDYEALLAKAAAIDEVRAEQKQIKDTAFGRIGGLQQIINELQSSTKRGPKGKVTPETFKKLIDEGYPDFAEMIAEGLNSADFGGTDSKPISQDEINQIFQQRFTPEREALKTELRQEIAAETLSALHEDWQDVVKSSQFQGWMKENKVDELKDRHGVSFADSLDARFVAKQIDAYKTNLAKLQAAKQKQAARQNRIDAAVQPKGSGGTSTAQTDEDDFYSGFKGAHTL